jgi:hypothetical protein
MKAIKVRLLYHTSHRPIRLVASAEPHNHNRLVRPLDAEMTHDENVVATAKALAEKLRWSGGWVKGFLDNHTDVFVNVSGIRPLADFTTAGSP